MYVCINDTILVVQNKRYFKTVLNSKNRKTIFFLIILYFFNIFKIKKSVIVFLLLLVPINFLYFKTFVKYNFN